MDLQALRQQLEAARNKSAAMSNDESEELSLRRELAAEQERYEREESIKKELVIARLLETCKAKFPNDVVESHDLGNAGNAILRSNSEAYDAWNKSDKDEEAKRKLLWSSVCATVPELDVFRDNVYVKFKATLDSTLAIVHRLNGLAVDNAFLKSISSMR
jgi:hypothetical protein